MSTLEIANKTILDLFLNHQQYPLSVNGFFDNLKIEDKERMDSLKILHFFFEHYFFYKGVTFEFFSKETRELVVATGVALAAISYTTYDMNEAMVFYKKIVEENGETVSPRIENAFVAISKQKEDYSLATIIPGSVVHLSIKFNLPVWFIKTVLRQYGLDKGKEILPIYKKQFNYHFALCYFVGDKEIPFDDFKKYKFDNGLYEYVSEERVSKSSLFLNKTMIPIQKMSCEVFKYLPMFNNKYLTLYLGGYNPLYNVFIKKYSNNSNVLNIASKKLFDNRSLLDNSANNIKNISVYESDESEMIAHLISKQDLVFYIPKTSNLYLYMFDPTYRVLFDNNDLDSIIKDEENGFYQLTKFVAENGLFVYYAETLNKKETTNIVKDFLNKNKNFSLLNEEIILPSLETESTVYYAILKRNKND